MHSAQRTSVIFEFSSAGWEDSYSTIVPTYTLYVRVRTRYSSTNFLRTAYTYNTRIIVRTGTRIVSAYLSVICSTKRSFTRTQYTYTHPHTHIPHLSIKYILTRTQKWYYTRTCIYSSRKLSYLFFRSHFLQQRNNV